MANTVMVISCCLLVIGVSSCSDMLEVESERQNFNPSIDAKTDSVFYAFGIFEAMQQLADQYVFQGEMRGDLLKTTKYTDNNLRQLANFSATVANKYDSAYVYYRVINNCNYYLKHRKTDLYTGATNVVLPEYAGIMAIRAWAYLQLGRNYKRVPFFTEPLTEISQIDENDFPELTLPEIVSHLAPELAAYSGYQLPTYGVLNFSVGSPNWNSTQKMVFPANCFIPVDIVLGDMYLESGLYESAAKYFIIYLTRVAPSRTSRYLAPMSPKTSQSDRIGSDTEDDLPTANQVSKVSEKIESNSVVWSDIFSFSSSEEIISYIPFAVNKQLGSVTAVPLAFGFNYYASSEETKKFDDKSLIGPYVEEIQLLPSNELDLLSDSTEYYYYSIGGKTEYDSIRSCKGGDMRLRSIISQTSVGDSSFMWIDKYKQANVILYRTSTVWLHLAEAFNRLGMPDAAFAILKDGISKVILETPGPDYITEETKNHLKTTYPLLSDMYKDLFPYVSENLTDWLTCGIHCHGAGKAASDIAISTYTPGKSPYQFARMTAKKLREIEMKFNLSIGATPTKQDTINAVEDLLCDEYALELAFEGNRYYDLMRLANHKNGHSGSDSQYDGSPAGYPANFGYVWLKSKLGNRGWDESKMYLPFK